MIVELYYYYYYLLLSSVSSGYGIVLVSTSTAGPHVSHCVEGSSMVRTDSHSPSETEPQTSVLPEDIGQRTAMTLIEEIVRVSSLAYTQHL